MTDPKILEKRFAVRLERFGIRPDSGGAGQWRGGQGRVAAVGGKPDDCGSDAEATSALQKPDPSMTTGRPGRE